MKGLTKEELGKMPIGTLFIALDGDSLDCFEEISVFQGNEWSAGEILSGGDFYYSDIVDFKESEDGYEELVRSCRNGKSVPIDTDFISREGLFDDERRYLIFEKGDLEKLAAVVATALKAVE